MEILGAALDLPLRTVSSAGKAELERGEAGGEGCPSPGCWDAAEAWRELRALSGDLARLLRNGRWRLRSLV